MALEGPGSSLAPIQGNYMPVLQADLINGQPASAAISQTGTLPASAQTLLFTASLPYGAGWSVSLGGQNLSVVSLGTDGNEYGYYGANISSFAGQTETLQFTALTGAPSVNMALDDIVFSL